MYYLRKENYGGEDIAIYKHHDFARFYRREYKGFDLHYHDELKLYACKSLKRIMDLRQVTYDYCGVWFDVYDENGKVEIDRRVE